MKDLILDFSWDKLWSLPPTELLAFLFIGAFVLALLLGVLGLVVRVLFD